MKAERLEVRVDVDTRSEIEERAERMGISVSAVCRMFIVEGLARHDRRFDVFRDRLDQIEKLVQRTHAMASAGVAATLLPRGTERALSQDVADHFQRHVDTCIHYGRAIKHGHDNGVFDQEGKDVSAD